MLIPPLLSLSSLDRHFSGGPADDRDYGFDNNYNCPLFSLVVFMSAEAAPCSSSLCKGPTSSSYKLLQWIDHIE